MRRWIWFGVMLAICVTFLLVFKRHARRHGPGIPADTLLLAYPLRQGGWRQVARPVANFPATPQETVQRLMQEMTRPDSDLTVFPPLPETFPLRSVFVDGGILYIDMPGVALEQLSGGSQEEMILIESLKRTLSWNLPDVERFQILVEGQPRRTLGVTGEDAGHINVLQPIGLKK